MHSLTCNGVGEFYLVAVQTESFGLVAVEFIADDGTAQAIGVGTVHAQLVGASRVGPEGEEGLSPLFCQYPILGDGAFA